MLDQAFAIVPEVLPGSFDRFAQHLSPEWIEEALVATGTATVRRRRLPAEQVLWLVVGMALMRNESIQRVAALLNVALPSTKGPVVAPSALTQARQRLGAEPVEYLFRATGAEWALRSAERHRWRGLAIFALDGSTIRVPDTPEMWSEFGGQLGNGKRSGSAYPTVRVVGLIAARSHLLAAMRVGPYSTGEVTLARELWPELPNNSLVLVDRNFLVAADLNGVSTDGSNRHWLTRAKKTTRLKTLKRLGPRDELVEIELSEQTRKKNPGVPAQWVARAIRYQRKGYPSSVLLTSLTDPAEFPREEIVALYHERWEIELTYDELKTHMLAREETIRSRTPATLRQELWAIGLAYNLVRLEMERVADEAGVPPTRISFVNALSLIIHAWVVWSTPPLAPGRIPNALQDLRTRMRLMLLPTRRPGRSFPRAVKIKMSNYTRKPPVGRGPN